MPLALGRDNTDYSVRPPGIQEHYILSPCTYPTLSPSILARPRPGHQYASSPMAGKVLTQLVWNKHTARQTCKDTQMTFLPYLQLLASYSNGPIGDTTKAIVCTHKHCSIYNAGGVKWLPRPLLSLGKPLTYFQ